MNATTILAVIGMALDPTIQADVKKLYHELVADIAGGVITPEQAVDRIAELNTQIMIDRKQEAADMDAKAAELAKPAT